MVCPSGPVRVEFVSDSPANSVLLVLELVESSVVSPDAELLRSGIELSLDVLLLLRVGGAEDVSAADGARGGPRRASVSPTVVAWRAERVFARAECEYVVALLEADGAGSHDVRLALWTEERGEEGGVLNFLGVWDCSCSGVVGCPRVGFQIVG